MRRQNWHNETKTTTNHDDDHDEEEEEVYKNVFKYFTHH